jgi:cupin fold WbuC family metalloprotein
MPRYIKSKVNPDITLLAINSFEEITSDRTDICDDARYLQISTKKLSKDTLFKPHKHLTLHRETDTTHEAWIVFSGSIEASFYDIDDSLLEVIILKRGDCAVVYEAGHSFKVLEENTILYEVKNGPYYGQEKDKRFLKF